MFALSVFPSPVAPVNQSPWTLPPLLHTPPLPATHLGLGTGLNTGRKRYDPLTLWMRLRVAQAKTPIIRSEGAMRGRDVLEPARPFHRS